MTKTFNVSGACNPGRHYMVNLEPRLYEIKKMIDAGKYFTINRARQYGKTTMLRALADYLKEEYTVLSLDFQRLSALDFSSEEAFVRGLAREVRRKLPFMADIPSGIEKAMKTLEEKQTSVPKMAEIFDCFTRWCAQAKKPLVLLVDEVDTATNNQVFLDFLAQLRAGFMDRDEIPTFQSVILASVYDIRNIQRKLRPDEDHWENSPWNIAADFLVEMSFSVDDIAGMLAEYEDDHHTGMDRNRIAVLLYDYTSGYPYLVSRLCSFMDERLPQTGTFSDGKSAWTKEGVLASVKMLLDENNPLFDSLVNKLTQFPELDRVVAKLLFQGQTIAYDPDDIAVRNARMFGFVKVKNSTVQIANRIFETRLYNRFLLDAKDQNDKMYGEGARQKNQFVANGYLNVRLILEKFVETFDYLYGDREDTFVEEEGRRYFMLFLKPIINGVGNCYVEPETRNRERMDLVIDYNAQQYICELKIWHGNAYNERGEEQLSGYLDHFHLKKGYMLSFNFNKKKQIGVKESVLGDKVLVEAVV